MRIFVNLLIFLGIIAMAGCQAYSPGTVDLELSTVTAAPFSTSSPDSPSQIAPTPDRIDATMTKQPERVPPTEPVTPVIGEVPTAILASILKDLAARTGVNVENIVVYQAQAVQWSDGSLGCAQPGMFYTQAIVSGYWVILKIEEKQYDYHANDSGSFFLCEGMPRPNPPATPSS